MLTTNPRKIHVAKRYIFLPLVGLCICLTAAAALATEKDTMDTPAQAVAAVSSQEADNFQYQLEGRPDPFLPFIQPKVASKLDLNEIVEGETKLTGMQLFEPGQLKLVGVMESRGKKIAMVEDVTGKGYVLTEGTLIGRHGVVSRITADNDVIITETARTRAGKKIVTTVVMRLNKEGDQ